MDGVGTTGDQCDLVRHAENWHEDNPTRPEDVIIASFVMLRRLAVSLRLSFPRVISVIIG